MTDPEALERVEALFRRQHEAGIAPGLAYGVVADGALRFAGGFGTSVADSDRRPGVDTVFRIASMTKSFTAATILLLRDEGRLGLDDAAEAYVPQLGGLRLPTADSPRITIRQLLTMSAGFPTDDPWGDRQQSLPLDAFDRLLEGGLTFASVPGTRYEYSNLGYAILGRLITAVTGNDYADVVTDRLLHPLGMRATTFDRDAVPAGRLARGYARRDDRWDDEPIDGYGAFAPMGGLFSSVADLARWVVGFADAYPPRDDADEVHPLRRASRREMQTAHRELPLEVQFGSPDKPPRVRAGGYGFGLGIAQDLRSGTVVGHGGGYPGFGSYMCWHPASGIGVIALANARYAPLPAVSRDALALLVAADERPGRLPPLPAAIQARAAVERLVAGWDERLARSLFAMNVELDEPLARRRAALEGAVRRLGPLAADTAFRVESDSPAHLAWWMSGARGRLRLSIRVTPEQPPRVQTLDLAIVPRPTRRLRRAARLLVAQLGRDCPSWPDELVAAAGLDRGGLLRVLRAASDRFGRARLGPAIAGDGRSSATFRVAAERGSLELGVDIDVRGGAIDRLSLTWRERAEP